MDMQGALRARLLAAVAISSRVGARVSWGNRPQGSPLPAIVLYSISDPRPQHLKGFEDFRETRVQADCLASDYATARALAEAVIGAAIPPNTSNGVRFLRGGAEGPRDLGEQTATEFVHRQSVDLFIRHGVEG